jgi:hypothetical protein
VLKHGIAALGALVFIAGAVQAEPLSLTEAVELSAKTGRPIVAVYGSET